MKLTDQQRKILCAVQFHADAPVSFVRKKTGFRDHTIHYHLNRFKEEELIRRAALINVFTLGYSQYEVYFSIAAKESTARDGVMAFCKESPRIALYAELGGRYQYSMTVVAKSGQEMSTFLEELTTRFGNIFVKKSVALVVSFNLFRKKYLVPRTSWFDSLALTDTGTRVELDELDRKILNVLFGAGQESIESVARTIREPRSTIDLRLKKLEERGVIAGYIYLINAPKFGILTYRLLISASGMAEGLREKLLTHCSKQPNIVNMSCCLGAWDYELTVEVEEPLTVVRVTEGIYSAFPNSISEIEILPVFTQGQSRNYMRFAEQSETKKAKRK